MIIRINFKSKRENPVNNIKYIYKELIEDDSYNNLFSYLYGTFMIISFVNQNRFILYHNFHPNSFTFFLEYLLAAILGLELILRVIFKKNKNYWFYSSIVWNTLIILAFIL